MGNFKTLTEGCDKISDIVRMVIYPYITIFSRVNVDITAHG